MNNSRNQARTLSARLYRADRPFWLTEVSVSKDLKVTFCSGDADRTWYTMVNGEHTIKLLVSLKGEANGDATLSVEQLMSRIMATFKSDTKNPYESIKRHLAAHDIPYSSQVW